VNDPVQLHPTEPQPQFANPELERAVLGGILLYNEVFWDAAKIISGNDFSVFLHEDIWNAIDVAMRGGRVADPTTLKTVIEIPPYVLKEAYPKNLILPGCQTLRDLHLRRQMYDAAIEGSELAMEAAVGTPSGELLDQIQRLFADIREEGRFEGSRNDMSQALQESLNRSADAYKQDIVPGVPWVLSELEALTGEPIQFGSVYGILADSGGGKTSLGMQQLYHAAKNGHPAIFFSYEQTPSQCADQIHSQQLGVEARQIRQGRITMEQFDEIHRHSDTIVKWPMAVQSAAGCSCADLRVRVQSFMKRHRERPVVIIDHAKRVKPADYRAGLSEQVNQVYGDLKSLALDLDCAVVLLMQRNSRGLDRSNPEPVDGDAYGGGSAKENLDYLIAIWREVKWVEQKARLERNQEKKDDLLAWADRVRSDVKLINLKARFAKDGKTMKARYEERYTRFTGAASSDQADLIGY
jgi:replicative DNA helicase